MSGRTTFPLVGQPADEILLSRPLYSSSKQLSPVDVLTATLERIDRLNPIHNAFVVVDPEAALRDARASEARWQRGAPGGLIDGLPATVKDLVVVEGWPTRRGSRTTDPTPSEEDAPPVARMRARCRVPGQDHDAGVRLERRDR